MIREGISDVDTAGTPGASECLDLERLILDHHAILYRYAFRLSGCQAEAEDLTQQTYLVAQQKLTQIRQPDKVRAWLFAVLRSCFLKSRRKRSEVATASLEMNIDEIPAEWSREDVIDRELLQQAIAELPDEFRIVLAMFYFEDCSYKEIADQLDIAIGTVMSRLSRAKGRLRQRLLASGQWAEVQPGSERVESLASDNGTSTSQVLDQAGGTP